MFDSEIRQAKADHYWAVFEGVTEWISWIGLFGFTAYVIYSVI